MATTDITIQSQLMGVTTTTLSEILNLKHLPSCCFTASYQTCRGDWRDGIFNITLNEGKKVAVLIGVNDPKKFSKMISPEVAIRDLNWVQAEITLTPLSQIDKT